MESYKSFHASVSKLSKKVDKLRASDYAAAGRTAPLDAGALRELIILHCYRSGYLETAERLCEAWSCRPPEREVRVLLELHRIAVSLRARDLEPGLAWVAEHREALARVESNLEFRLVQLQYLELLSRPGAAAREEALAFAQERFPQFSRSHAREVQRCMGALLWCGALEQSPYAALADSGAWEGAVRELVQAGCVVNRLPERSHLLTAFVCGAVAVPTIAKMLGIMGAEEHADWSAAGEELPVELPLPERLTFHSLFSCPLSREESSAENPPVLLKCGHVILRSSMLKVLRNGRFKCPTCPVEQTVDDAREMCIS